MSLSTASDIGDVHRRFAEEHDRADFIRLVHHYRPLSRRIARRFPRGSLPLADIEQAADEGLIGAIVRFDPTRGCDFTSFAHATISGTIKRYLRNSVWLVRVPRRTRDLSTHVRRAVELLEQELHRQPAVHEVADWLGRDERHVRETIESLGCSRAWSLDLVTADASRPPNASMTRMEADLSRAEEKLALGQALSRLGPSDRELIDRYYVRSQSQSEIATRMGMSQTQVSRRLRQAVRFLRQQLDD